MATKIYIDQGHNPESPNAGAEGNGYREQDITYRVGIELAQLLRSNGNFDVRLSRPTPSTPCGATATRSSWKRRKLLGRGLFHQHTYKRIYRIKRKRYGGACLFGSLRSLGACRGYSKRGNRYNGTSRQGSKASPGVIRFKKNKYARRPCGNRLYIKFKGCKPYGKRAAAFCPRNI